MKRLRQAWPAYASAALFILCGAAFISEPGLEEDEVMFATALFRDWVFFALPIGKHRLPLMHMSYVGALKTWICTPIFWIFEPTTVSLRVPALLLGAATIILFWYLLDRVHSRRAAIAGTLLLATDTIYLITDTLDWGPVVLQHLLTIAAVLFAVSWYQRAKTSHLCAAAFCAGLAFWDKAVFAWMFTGLCAGLVLFAPGILRRSKIRTAALAIASFLIGAAPLVYYNLKSEPKFSTFKSNAKLAPPNWPQAIQAIRRTWNGSGLLGMPQTTASQPSQPRTVIERVSFSLHTLTGDCETNPTELALIAAMLLMPWLWRTPARGPMLFAIVATVVAWFFSLTAGGGISPHHIILLWPLPTFFLAVALAQSTERTQDGHWIAAVVLLILCVGNLLVTNEYLYRFARYGSSIAWTDAINPLAASLAKKQASQAVIIDWGISDQLCVLNRNDPSAHPIPMPLNEADLTLLSDEKAIWVQHTADHQIFKDVNEAATAAFEKNGFKRTDLETIYDRNGRAIFETYRLKK